MSVAHVLISHCYTNFTVLIIIYTACCPPEKNIFTLCVLWYQNAIYYEHVTVLSYNVSYFMLKIKITVLTNVLDTLLSYKNYLERPNELIFVKEI